VATMSKTTAARTAELTGLLTDLQRQLRAKIRKSPPLFVVEIKNDFSPHPDFLQILMRGIAGPNRAYVRLGTGPEIGDIIAFGDNLESIDKSIATLREVTPAIFDLIDHLRKTRIEMTPDHQLTMVAPLICTLVEIAKKNHPRARSLPKIIAGPVVYHTGGPARLEFPTGNNLPRDTIHSEIWQQIHTDLNGKQPTVRLLEASVLQGATMVAKQMLASIKPKKRPPRLAATERERVFAPQNAQKKITDSDRRPSNLDKSFEGI
jgi:hypothetical protein